MDKEAKNTQQTLKTISKQILMTAPILKKRIFRPDFEQKQNPIPLSYVQVLAALNEKEKMSVSEISNRFDIAKPNITPLIDRLIEAGYVKRVRNTEDRRVVFVVIEEKGREKVESVVEALAESIKGWSNEITPDKLTKLSEAIETLRDTLEEK